MGIYEIHEFNDQPQGHANGQGHNHAREETISQGGKKPGFVLFELMLRWWICHNSCIPMSAALL